MSVAAQRPEESSSAFHCVIPADPCTIVIFGASGDLTQRKLLPALWELASAACLAPRFAIVGFARSGWSDEKFRQAADGALGKQHGAADQERRKQFLSSLRFFQGEYDNPESFAKLRQRLEQLDQELNLPGNRLFYLAVPPETYAGVIEQIGAAGLAGARGKGWVRVIIEKPFGRDLESARKLNRAVLHVFDESQVYRIDHYLGKETVQNLLVFRFSNGIFEPLWNRNYIDHVQITAAESLGVERRASFYETAGAMRDMVQSHVLQLVSLVAMEPPAVFDATAVRNEKIKVLQSIHPFDQQRVARDVVFGQYGRGQVNGEPLPGYREESGVRPDSHTETFVALRLEIENWRWAGIPFYLRTGKRLRRRATEVAIRFRRAPHVVFRGEAIAPNWLVLNIQPEEGISLSFGAKLPGPEMEIRPVTMDFRYRESFGPGSDSAYTTLLNDCMRGDATLFDRSDSVEASWALVDPVIAAPRPAFPNYPAGSWGPREADELLRRDGNQWRES